MADTSITKVSSGHSPRGAQGQRYLASGTGVAMRLWEEEPADGEKPASRRDYETVGFVIEGTAELEVEGQTVRLEQGDSWALPAGAEHRYRIISRFVAVEATHPPAHVHGRDDP